MECRVKELNPDIEIIRVSCRTGQGIYLWANWLRKEIKAFVG